MPAPVGNAVRQRPALFRALGRRDPPQEIHVDGHAYQRHDILKHDSWAATAIYRRPGKTIVCKFNRLEPIFGIPMDWLGRWLAWREKNALTKLAGLPGIPPACGKVYAGGQHLVNAVAHDYVEGHPLGKNEKVRDDFFPTLQASVAEMHRRGIVYVDLHKRENILVGDDGRPYLIDFQIHFRKDPGLPFANGLFRLLARSDQYHLSKHECHHQGRSTKALVRQRPWWIRLHRLFAEPLRQFRRKLLIWFRIRKGQGRAETEHFAEDAVRRAA
jgi:hypothetical protein